MISFIRSQSVGRATDRWKGLLRIIMQTCVGGLLPNNNWSSVDGGLVERVWIKLRGEAGQSSDWVEELYMS